jgi:hypothetical protein
MFRSRHATGWWPRECHRPRYGSARPCDGCQQSGTGGTRPRSVRRADLNTFETRTQCDAVIARHVLIHLSEPLALLGRARSFVKPGGILVSRSSTCRSSVRNSMACQSGQLAAMPVPHCLSVPDCLFGRAPPCIPGFSKLVCRPQIPVDGGSDSVYYEWVAQTMRSLLPKMPVLGVLHPDTIDIDHFEEELRQEALTAQRPCMEGPMRGAIRPVRRSNHRSSARRFRSAA